MKKIAIVYSTIVLLLVCVIIMVGCSMFSNLFGPSESEDMANKINTFLEYLQNKDKEGLKSLFAQNKIASLPDFDQSIEELFVYFDGEVTSISKKSPGVEQDKDSGIERK